MFFYLFAHDFSTFSSRFNHCSFNRHDIGRTVLRENVRYREITVGEQIRQRIGEAFDHRCDRSRRRRAGRSPARRHSIAGVFRQENDEGQQFSQAFRRLRNHGQRNSNLFG